MPISLRDSLEPLTLRESARYAPGQANFADHMEAEDTNPISRGWTATSEGLQGSDLLAEANAAERAGDMLRVQQLELQAQDHMQRAQTWAPTTQNFTDIDGLGAAAGWLGGQVGSGARSMIAPLAGGVGGRVVGGLLGALTPIPGGAAIGANLGGALGAFGPGYDMQYNESVGQSMMDPEIRAKRSAEEIHRTGQKVGAAGGALEAVVPASVAKIGLGGIGKRTIGGVMAREAGEEALTEGAQSYVGQTGQNQLAGRELTDYDHLDAFNAAMAGAVGGGVMGGAGAAVGAARDKLATGAEKVADVARDPVQSAVDAVHRVVKGDPIKRADSEIAEFESGRRSLSKMFEDERTSANDERIFDAPKADEPDAQVSARMREDIDRWADRILSSPPRTFGPREEELRSAAAQYKSDGDWMKLRGVLRKNKLADERSSMMSSFELEGEKASEMTPEGQELDALSNAWLKNEGKRYGEYFSDGSDEAKGLGAKLFAWIKNDFGAKMTDDGEIFIPRTFIEALGDRAPGVVESAITAARKEGWDIKNAGDAVATIRQYVNSNEGDTSFLTSAIRYSQQENWTPKMVQRFAKELRQKGGRLDKDDYRWLKTQVGDIVGVLEHFQKPSRFYKAEKNMGMKSYSGLTQAARDQDEKAGITENDSEWGSGVSEVEVEGGRKIKFVGVDKEGYPFDTANGEQLSALRAKVSTFANDPAVFAKEIGVWQQAKRAAKGDKAILAEYEDALIREHGNSLSDGDFQGDLNPVDLTDSERNSVLSQINKRFRTVEVEGVVADKDPHKIAKEEVQSFRVDSVTNNRRSPEKETAKNGFIFLERNIGGKISYFPTTTARLLQHIRGNRRLGKEGAANIEREVKLDGKDSGAAGAMSHLEQAIADLIASDKTFTGRIGYKMRGEAKEPILLADKQRFPGALSLGDGVSTAADAYRGRKYEARREGAKELERDDGPKEIATVSRVDFTTVKHFMATDPSTGHKIGSKRQAEAVAQAMRGTQADVVGAEKRNGQWGVAYNTREERRSTGHLSETDEMSEGAGKRLERSVREFQEETGLSLEADIPAGIKRMVAQVLQNARKAWSLADGNQRKQLKKLIEDKKYFSADKLADTIRFSREDSKNAKLPQNGHGQVSRDSRSADQGGRAGTREAETLSRPDSVVPSGDRVGAGANPQDRKGNSNRDAGGRDSDRKSVTDEGGAKRQADEGNLTKQDAWVMKFASMSKKDMRNFVASLPSEKLGKVFSALNVFHPVDNSNPFWQRNNLDNYTDAKSDVVFEAQELIRDRLDAEGGSVARVFAQDRRPTARQAEVLGKHYSDIEFKIVTSKAQPLRLDAFHKVAKHIDSDMGLLGYAEQNSKTLRAWAEGARGFLTDLGFPVADTHILFTEAGDNTLGSHWGGLDAILLDKNAFEKALSGDKIEQANLPLLLAHEASHALDNGGLKTSSGAMTYSSTKNQRFIVSNEHTIGDIGREIIDVYNSRGEYWDHFAYPVSKTHNDLNAKDKVREAFAQLFTAYALDPRWSEKHTPKFFQLAQEIDNAATLKDVATIISGGNFDWTKFAAYDGKNPRATRRVDRRAAGRVGRATGIDDESRPEIRLGLREGSVADGVKNSEQTTSDFKQLDPEQALADIARMLGKDFDAKVVEKLGGKAGTWKPGIIRMATSAADGTQFHEALHELFNQMRTHGAANVAQIIERVANSPLILRKLEQLLSDHPKAIKQLKTPEEAAAYLFQFWNMGLINVGPETKSLFQTIKDLIVDAAKELHSWVNAAKRDERKTEKAQKMDEAEVRRLFEALAGGAAATSDVNVRQALYDGLRKNIEAHTKAVEDLGQRVEGFWQGIGRYVVTSESMLNLYSKHPELKTVADKFHQMAGKSMKNQARNSSLMARGGLIEAKHAEVQRRLNPFERFLLDGQYDEKDMALAAKHLEANTKSADKKINNLIDFVHRYYGEMYDYMVQSDVRRLDPHSEERWVPIQKRKDYFTQSWSIEELTKDHDGFASTLLDKHAKELAHMAQQANAEIAAWNKDPKTELTSPTAKALRDKQDAEFKESGKIIAKSQPLPNVTPEMIAEQIYVRLLNSTGMVDIQETNWSLGLTPAAGAVNRRELDWLDKEAFSKYKSKDLVEIVTNYTRTMVSRAEYQKRFGYGGEVIGDAMDTAMLREMGGQALVDSANASLDGEIKRWKKDARAWYKDNPGVPYAEPYPTLRLVGIQQHRAQVGADASNEALIKAEKNLRPAVNAVRALEGTLGNDISPALRSFNSWINTYQNVRLLPLALFTNFSDVIGITTNGGTLGDAWNAFTAGMREVRNTWMNEKGTDSATLRAEEWGVSDAGAMLDTLGQNYSSVYMTEKARNINNKFFRIIGMEGWNRGVRITATSVGERIIGDWVKNGVDAKKPGEKARFERLFGEGADPKKIKLDAQGNLDTQDAANRAAIQRFVQDSVMSSNSAVRAIWMSDPRMATFAHLKNFAYAFHSVMLKGILAQAAEGNLRPALVAGLGFASISIAAAAVKEMLIPGDEPYWMKGGLDGYLEYGYGMANLGGVPQMYLDSVTDFDPAKLAGPFWDQIQNTLSSPIPGFGINLSPVDGETEILRDRKVMVELAKALPAGNLAGRAMDSLVGD